MSKTNDESRIKKDEIRGYSDYAKDTEGLNWTDSIVSIRDTIKEHSKGVQWQYIQRFIKSTRPMQVLDCGAGRCWASYLLAQAGCTVIAVDFNTDNVAGLGAGRKIIEETGITFHLVCADLEHLPFKEGIFDLAFGSQFLHHAFSLQKMLQEISNVLAIKGILISMNEHTIPIYMKDDEIFRSKHPAVASGVNEHAYHFKHYMSSLEDAGLDSITAFPYPYWEEYLKKYNHRKDGNSRVKCCVKSRMKSIVFRILYIMYRSVILKRFVMWIVRSFALTSFSFVAEKNVQKNRDRKKM